MELDARPADRPPCPVCLGPRFVPLFEALGHRFERCRSCGFQRMADPVPAATLDRHYAQDEDHGWEAYREHDKNRARFGEMIARIEARLPPRSSGEPRRFLDVGCSIGTSLVAARERGWEAVGTELCRPAVEWARKEWGLDVRAGLFEELDLPPASFDAVFQNHTLEHLREPDRVLERIHGLLRPQGVVYQALPNHGSLKARLFREHWSYGIQPGHLSLFTRRTLARLLERTGFAVVEVRTFSSRADPHLYYGLMARTGRLERLKERLGGCDPYVDNEAYARYVTDHRFPFWLCNHAWPGGLVQRLGLGEDLHVLAVKRG